VYVAVPSTMLKPSVKVVHIVLGIHGAVRTKSEQAETIVPGAALPSTQVLVIVRTHVSAS